MAEKDRDEQKPESAKPISRREFAKGSMAVLGAYSSFPQSEQPEPLSAAAKAIKLEISDQIRSYLEVRHVLDDDVRRVIEHAERTGLKLYQQGNQSFLSKLRMGEAMFYVEYSPNKEAYKIHTAYTHRSKLPEE
jgi:hypothetical protein